MLALRAFICEAHIPDYLQFGRDIFDLLTDGLLAQNFKVGTALRTVHLVLRCIALDFTYREVFDDLNFAGALVLPGKALGSPDDRLFSLAAGLELDLVEQRQLLAGAVSDNSLLAGRTVFVPAHLLDDLSEISHQMVQLIY